MEEIKNVNLIYNRFGEKNQKKLKKDVDICERW